MRTPEGRADGLPRRAMYEHRDQILRRVDPIAPARAWPRGWKYSLHCHLSNTDYVWFWRPRFSRVAFGEYWFRWGHIFIQVKVWRQP